jgi:hypothetical protein
LLLGALAITVVLVGGLLVTRDDSDRRTTNGTVEKTIGRPGGSLRIEGLRLEIPPGAVAGPTRVRITRLAGTAPNVYPAATSRLSPAFEVDVPGRLARRVSLIFETRTASRRDLVAARQPEGSAGWELVRGRRVGSDFVVTTRELSGWQVRLPKIDTGAVSRGVKKKVHGWLGTRRQPLECQSADAPEVRDDDPEDPLLYACLERQPGGEPALRVRNNRGVGLEFDLPDGVAIAELTGRSLGEAVFDEINEALSRVGPTGNGRLLPGGGGEVLLTGDLDDKQLSFRVATTGLVADALLLLAPRGESAEAIADAASCAFTSGDRGASATKDSVRDVLVDCASAAFSAAGEAAVGFALSAPGFAVGLGDALGDLGRTTEITVSIPAPPRLPEVQTSLEVTFSRDGLVHRIGPFAIPEDRTVGDLIRLFGRPTDTVFGKPYESACTMKWSDLGLQVVPENFGAPGACTDPAVGLVQIALLTSPLWEIEGGLRVGWSEARLTAEYPDATTRFPGSPSFDVDAASIYALKVVGGPVTFPSLLAHVDRRGDVIAIELTPLLAGD